MRKYYPIFPFLSHDVNPRISILNCRQLSTQTRRRVKTWLSTWKTLTQHWVRWVAVTGRLANSGKRCVGRHSTGVSSAPSCSGRRHFSTGPCWPSSAFPESPAAQFQALERVVVGIHEVAFGEVGKILVFCWKSKTSSNEKLLSEFQRNTERYFQTFHLYPVQK